MGFRINTNTLSLNAQRNLSKTTKAFAKSLERLSSGSRINRAGDDAAGLAIAEGLRAQNRGLRQVVRNINDSNGFLTTAEGALSTQAELLQRMRELALQAANGTIGNSDRSFLNEELQELLNEFSRITEQTSFNGRLLLDGNLDNLALQVGTQSGDLINVSIDQSSIDSVVRTEVTGQDGSFQSANIDAFRGGDLIGDFNGDGHLDIANDGNDSFDLRFGNGDGTFGATILSALNLTDGGVSDIGDLNNDGIDDLIISTGDDSTLFVRIGNGDGTFASVTPPGYDTGSGRLADFNNDGTLDLFVRPTLSRFEVLLGNGDGTFEQSASIAYDDPGGSRTSKFADFNGDGNIDIISTGFNVDNFELYLGDGRGDFSLQTLSVKEDDDFFNFELGDLDGDGDLDIISERSNVMATYFNDGNGSFSFGSSINVSVSEYDVADLNSDGRSDVVLRSGEILFADTSGNLEAGAQVNTGLTGFNHIGLGDFNEDGALDITAFADTNESSILFGNINTFDITNEYALNIATQTNAQNFLAVVDQAMQQLNATRAEIGAQQSRLDSAAQSTRIAAENIAQSMSQIFDADIAEETAELTRSQILQQAGVAVLAQANTSQQLALQLLNNI